MSLLFIDNRDGERYKIARIGDQLWFAENLRYHIDECSFAYDHEYSAYAKYGYLYSSAALARVCPLGCRVPTEMDYRKLFNYVGRNFEDMGLMDVLAHKSWEKGFDFLGLHFLPGGCGFKKEDEFFDVGRRGYFWTDTSGDNGYKKFLSMGIDSVTFCESGEDIDLYSVRLIVDNAYSNQE